MELVSKRNVKNLLQKYGIYPSKRLGQNFLINRVVLKKIIEAADLKLEDIILEIGPGAGTITQELAKRVKRVIAVEKDKRMVEILKENLKEFKNVEIIKSDILKLPLHKLQATACYLCQGYEVVANLPFYLTAPVIRKFLEAVEVKPQQMVLIVQKEVGQRICAKPPDMNLLAVSVQFYAEPKIISFVSKRAFWPRPKVDGAIIKIVPRQFRVQVSRQFRERFFRIVKAGFSQPRKQLINNLSRKLKIDKPRSRASSLRGKEKIKNWLLKNNIQPSQRAETLSIEDWLKLTKSLPHS